MALIKCENCGNLISENATECPKCGHPRQTNIDANQPYNEPPKNKTTAGILAILLGGIGIHYFYINKPIAGVLFLLLCWTYIPAIIALIQGILMLTMPYAEFNAKYVNTNNKIPFF